MGIRETTLSAYNKNNRGTASETSSSSIVATIYYDNEDVSYTNSTISARLVLSTKYNSTYNRYDCNASLQFKKSRVSSNDSFINIKFTRYVNSVASDSGSFSGLSKPNPLKESFTLSSLSTSSWTEIARWTPTVSTSYLNPSSTRYFAADLFVNFTISSTKMVTSLSTTTMAITNSIKITANGSAVQRTITFSKGKGTSLSGGSTKKGYDGDSFSLSSWSATPPSRTKIDSQQWTISYSGLEGVTSKTSTRSIYLVYSFSGWTSSNQGYKSPSASYTINGNDTLTAEFSDSTEYDGSCTITTLTSSKPKRKGYTADGTWHYNSSTGRIASIGDVVTSNTTLYSGWTPKNYSVKFDSNKGPKTDIPAQTTKTYGSAVYIPSWSPNRFGYKFIGWSGAADSKSILIGPSGGSYNSDALYDSVNTETSNNGITLYAQWEPINNTLEFNYYINSTTTVQKETLTYNIESTEVSKNAPSKPFMAGNDDYVFIGWTTVKPANFNSVSKGIYLQGNEFPDTTLPVKVTQADIKKVTEWGKTTTYYGIWSISGKYVFMGGQFRKCNSCWVKTKEPNEAFPTWKIVNNILVKKTIGTRTKWWPEVGRNS